MRVLIVEDEPYMAEAIRDGLRLEAIAADIAGDGDTALELLRVNAYDIAVLDRDIPGPTGDEIADRIVASGSGMPILMLTAADRLNDKATGFELGADDYLTKPFELQELVLNTRAIDLTEALLLLSRADRRSFARERVDLSLIAEEATETLLPLAEGRGLTIETSGDMTPTIGSHALLRQLSTNLLHNAIVHNLPEQGTVWVTTSVHPKTVVLTVENTGEKLTPQLVSTLVEPFLRGTKRIRTDHAGVGLGLAIVKSITRAHDGTLTLTPRAAGGLCVTVELPAAPPHIGR